MRRVATVVPFRRYKRRPRRYGRRPRPPGCATVGANAAPIGTGAAPAIPGAPPSVETPPPRYGRRPRHPGCATVGGNAAPAIPGAPPSVNRRPPRYGRRPRHPGCATVGTASGSDPSHSAAIGTIEEGEPVPIATRNPAMTRRPDDVQTIQASPREGMIGALSAGLVAAVAVGDLEAAASRTRRSGTAGHGVGPPAPTGTGAVVDLASARRAGR